MSASHTRGWIALFLTVALAATARAADKEVPREDLDFLITSALRDAINVGAEMFNHGDQAGCYQLYRRALTAALPFLDHRAALKKATEEKLAKAQEIASVDDRAFALREAIDNIRAAIRKDQPAPATKSLWDRLGGEAEVRAIVKDVLKLAVADPGVNFSRGGKFKPSPEDAAKIEQKLVEFLSSETGGPLKYTGRDMKTAHKGQGITGAEYNALGGILVKVLQEHKVGAAEARELIAIIAGYRKDIVEEKTLWDRLGGEAGVRTVTKEFLAAVAKDPKVNVDRGGNYPLTPARVARIEQLAIEFISSVTGGPLKYTGRDMKSAHQGMKITEAEFDAAAGHLIAALQKSNVAKKDIDELVALVGSVKKDIVEK